MKRLIYIFTITLLSLAFGTVSIYAQPKIKGNVYGGGENAKVKGQTLNAEGNWINDHGDGTVTTKVTINNGEVCGEVYGAGKGVKATDATAVSTTYDNIATVSGNTEVNVNVCPGDDKKYGMVWGDIYGGAALAIVEGNANVNIAGGKFANDVFGGGKGDVDDEKNVTSANVLKNTTVNVSGGEIVWNKLLDGEHNEVEWTAETHDLFFDDENRKYLTDYNIYAGGNIACVVGEWHGNVCKDGTGASNLTMSRGLLGADLLSSKEWKESYTQHDTPHFSAFGGGYGIYTKAHKSDVKVLMPMVHDDGTSDGDQQLVRPRRAPGASTSLDIDIYSDNYGVAWTTVLGVLGGGYNGHVETTSVLVGDATYAHRVYGGGLGSYEGWVEAGKPADAAAAAEAKGKVGTVGPLTGAPSETEPVAHVTIAGGHIHGDVFGGGAGVESREVGGVLTDFTEIARVTGNTLVETSSYETYLMSIGKAASGDEKEQRAQIFGNIYGGGDVANVTGSTSVMLYGGDVFGYTFGAGYGRLAAEANDYTKIGNVSGNSMVKIADLADFAGIPDDYDEPYKPTAWNDIYGGARNGITDGDATVLIAGGKVGNNVFGGGLGNVSYDPEGQELITSADVKGNTTVTVTGGSYLWRQIADINGNIKTFPATVPADYDGDYEGYDKPFNRNVVDNKMMLTQMFEPIKAFFDYTKASYTRDHSIYGGGNIACKVGTYKDAEGKYYDVADVIDMLRKPLDGTGMATVDMQQGLFEDTDIHWTDDEQWNLATLCRWLACENSSNYQFGVFGGGYGANTKVGNTEVTLRMGTSEANKIKWATYFGAISANYEALPQSIKNDYYGGSSGPNGLNRYLTARMANSINVPSHTVLTTAGGGLAGYVAGDTKVELKERSGALRIYGGGIGQRPSVEDQASLTQDIADAMTYGQVGGDTDVNVEYGVVVKDVYGGGAGVESVQNDKGEYIDFPNMARIIGKTDVDVYVPTPTDDSAPDPTKTLIYGMVFGGGDVANVGAEDQAATLPLTSAALDRSVPRSKVTVRGGCVFKDIYAGGSGRTKERCSEDDENPGNDGYKHLGAIYGNAQIIIDEPADKGGNATWIWRNVYGGGRNGTIYGNTGVQIKGGNLGYDIFGGGLGRLGTRYNPVTNMEEDVCTSADITLNTNVHVSGGKWCLSQKWDEGERNWEPLNEGYSSQYEPSTKKFNINHNVYGGGNVACTVGTYNSDGKALNESGYSNVLVTQGMIPDNAALGHTYDGEFFEQGEWKSVYEKHASPHFSVFGAGYGPDTKVDNTVVKVDMGTESPRKEPSNPELASKKPSEIFADKQTLMDVIGGGYEGGVNNTCDVNIDGYTFMRNVFGGAYYATVGNTRVSIVRANLDYVFGGGMMGDVRNDVLVTIGTEVGGDVTADAALVKNTNIIINEDVYGANDVAGYVGAISGPNGEVYTTEGDHGVQVKLNGGHIHGNVYGGGNGDYLYQIAEDVDMVTVEEDADIGSGELVTLYKVPLRASDFPSLVAMSDQQKLVNVISYRPAVMRVDIDFKGNSSADLLRVDGNIFGGGNSATVNDFDGNDQGEDARVHMNVGSHIRLGGIYLGSDGEALFESKHGYITSFPLINNIQLFDAIDWTTPENQNIPVKFLPTTPAKRPEVYKNNLDLYFMPVEMAVMPEVTWGKGRQNNSVNVARASDDGKRIGYQPVSDTEEGLTDAEIGTFCCGGNRGNMDTNTNFHVFFPEGLTITDKIVGGCNNANYTYNIPGTYDEDKDEWETLDHIGGFLLGSHGVGTNRQPQIQLTMRNKFKITETQEIDGETYYAQKGNVFGGCYEKGIVRGDILVEVFSNMLLSGRDDRGDICGLDSAMLRRTTDKGLTVASIYGAGYGPQSWVRGDTEVRLGDETVLSKSHDGKGGLYVMDEGAASCNYIFGGGRQGNVIGNTNVQIKNGRVGGCVVGASYAGLLYGSAQTMVGFPEKYFRAKVSRSYDILRADEDPTHADFVGDNGTTLIRKKVYYTKGDLITETTYQGIRDRIVENKRQEAIAASQVFNKADAITAAETELRNYFDVEHSIPADNDWSKVDIQIDKAIYGGGYALATGSGSYTVLKYTDENKFLDKDIYDTYGFRENGTTGWDNTFNNTTDDFIKYGGNTFVIVGDVSGNYDEQAETATDFSSTGGHASLSAVTAAEKDRDHITLSSKQLKLLKMKIGDDLFGLFKELTKKEAEPNKYDSSGGWSDPRHQAEAKEPSGQYMKITYDASYSAEEKQNGNRFYEFTGEGGIYGDGRLSLSEGFRVCDAIGYGYNGSTPKSPKLMNCIHRFDIARFKDCCISLLGDRDYTSLEGSDVNAVRYSIARVNEILMESSILQDRNYLETSQKHSRNYIGLSSSQFDLSAIKSNDVFGDDADAAYYHDKNGKMITTTMEIEGAGGKTFPELMSYYNVKKWYLNEYKINDKLENSEYYDDANAQVRNEMQFQLRNSATARNMFGIFSGYALNVHSTHYVAKKPVSYYGPVVGVFEVDLIGTREGEAGGYAYAQNIHTENAKDDSGDEVMKDGKHIHSFLETSGNFVFPATSVRKVVDNCTPIAYNSDTRDGAEGHYWYVTGFKYYYNATITGYTYDDKIKYFDSDNTITKRLVLTGTKKNQIVVLKNFHWLPRHAVEYYETVEEYNAAKGTTLDKAAFDALTDEEKIALDKQEMCDIEAKYLTKKDTENYTGTLAQNITEWSGKITENKNKPNSSPLYNLSLSLSEFGNYMEKTLDATPQPLPVMSIMPQDNYTMSGSGDDAYKIYQDQDSKVDSEQTKMSIGATMSNPLVGIRLTDCVNNNGKDADGVSYFSKYLDDPCVAKIVLTTPAINGKGERMWSAYGEVNPTDVTNDERTGAAYTNDPYYIVDYNGDYVSVTLDEAKAQVERKVTLFQVQKDVYEPVKGDMSYNSSMKYYLSNGSGYTETPVTDASDYESKKSTLYYLKTPAAHEESYVYDITLTIKYIKGPSYEGRIDIKNCALPGEMIRLSHENLKIESDIFSLPHNGSFWTIGPGKKVLNDPEHPENGYHWELIDETGTVTRQDAAGQIYKYNNPATRNLYYPYNPNVTDPLDNYKERSVSPIMRTGVYHDKENTEKPDYFIPAYYFMNGYVAQYSFTVSGIDDEVFTTTIHPEDTLLVHNYHRMAKAANSVGYDNADDIKLGHAMKEHGNASIPDRRQLIDLSTLTPDTEPYNTAVAHNANEEVLQTAYAAEWPLIHKRPRVYIEDVNDLRAFADYLRRTADQATNVEIRSKVDASGDKPEEPAVNLNYVQRYATDYGKDVDFFLMADIEVPSTWTPIANFKGRLHGNGHVIKGLSKLAEGNRALFAEIGDDAHIYNLGLQSGSIATTEKPAAYSNCYTFANKTVYHMDGTTPDTHYTDHDWRTGRVAYDLNEYYLAERLDRNTDAVGEPTNKDTHDHSGYVEDLYADGDYRYSRYSTNENASEYLRSENVPYYTWGYLQSLVDDPDGVSHHYYLYDGATHKLTHKVDEARAFYDEAVDAVLYADAEEYNAAKGTSLDADAFAALSDAEKIKTPAKPRTMNEFRPLFEEDKLNTTVEPVPTSQKRNDYIFFGQTINTASYTDALGTLGSNLPTVIDASSRISNVGSYEGVTHNVANQTNRVWRAYGFYRSKADDAFHFNREAWALHPELTAIDFTGAHDSNHTWAKSMADATATSNPIFYPMVMDMPEGFITSFDVADNSRYSTDCTRRSTSDDYDNSWYGRVTQNLLVYNNGEKASDGTDIFTYKDANESSEADVLYHNLVFGGSSAVPATNYFHLVDKQDFNAPIEFAVNERAWYERTPRVFRNLVDNDYQSSSAWEGICLPFTATKVTASENKEISHFYGEVPAEEEDNMQTLHHEYWLTGMVDVNGDKATFARPSMADATGVGLFTDEELARQESGKYQYPANGYFTSLSNYTDYHDDTTDDDWARTDAEWYLTGHDFADYVYLSRTVPYLISFPGNDFYEFSMQGTEYNTKTHSKSDNAQSVTYEHNGATTIAVSDDETGNHTTTIGLHNHIGTYLHETDKLGVNITGSAFSADTPDVLPFRTYMNVTSGGAAPRYIYIVDDGIEHIGEDEPNAPEDEMTGNVLNIWVEGHDIVIETSRVVSIRLCGISGVYMKTLDCKTGINRFPQDKGGLYIVGRKKVQLKH